MKTLLLNAKVTEVKKVKIASLERNGDISVILQRRGKLKFTLWLTALQKAGIAAMYA